jgi:glycosyltransferase involved in cell wall biosynthesis
MPTYNQGAFIQTAVESVLQQDVDLELLVYDAESSDDTARILEKYYGKLHWIREKDRGMVDAINKGLQAAQGEVIAWLNSDDAYLPGALAQVQQTFQNKPVLDFVYGDALEINRDGRIIAPNVFTEEYNPERYLHSHNYMCQPCVFAHRRLIKQIGPVREDLKWTMDYEWFARFYSVRAKGLRLHRFLAANRDYADTKTNSGGWARYCEMIRVHRMRPGPRMPLRRSFRIYTIEALIKAANAVRDRHAHNTVTAKLWQQGCAWAGHRFVRMVNPREREDIIQRYQQDIAPQGLTIDELWGNKR